MLTPLSTYSSRIIDGCYMDSSSPEQCLDGFVQGTETNSFPASGCLTPQTPESTVYHEPLWLGEQLDHYTTAQPWSGETFTLSGLDLDPDTISMLPTDIWSTPEPDNTMPLIPTSWPQHPHPATSHWMSDEVLMHACMISTLSGNEYSTEHCNISINNQEEWLIDQPASTHTPMASMAIPSLSTHGMQSIPSRATAWEDVFVPGLSSY